MSFFSTVSYMTIIKAPYFSFFTEVQTYIFFKFLEGALVKKNVTFIRITGTSNYIPKNEMWMFWIISDFLLVSWYVRISSCNKQRNSQEIGPEVLRIN